MKDVTLLEKMQVILQLQCDALIKLGYDKSIKVQPFVDFLILYKVFHFINHYQIVALISRCLLNVQEVVKYLWFLYLKRFGYAFVDNADTPTSSQPTAATPTQPTPTITPSTPTLATPTASADVQTPRSRARKRRRSEFDDDTVVAAPKKSRTARSSKKKGKGKLPPVREDLEESLFESSLALLEEDGEEGGEEEGGGEEGREEEDRAEERETPPTPDAEGGQEGESPAVPAARVTGNELYLMHRAKRRQKTKYFTVRFTAGLLYLGLLYTQEKILLADLTRYVSQSKHWGSGFLFQFDVLSVDYLP